MNWNEELLLQLTWHWDNQLRPRLDGLTDEEYFWEPVQGSWNIRPRTAGGDGVGSGDFVIDFAFPEPEPAPVTTIAWRMAHLLVGVYGARNSTYFGGADVSYQGCHYPGSAADALQRLDDEHARWVNGVRNLDDAALQSLCLEEGFDDSTMAALILHIHREIIHHGAEICLLRDLYAHRS